MNKVFNKNIQQYGAQSLLNNTEILFKALKGTTKRQNIEDIHDIRVASRRIRERLLVFEPYFPDKKNLGWLKTIKFITKTYGNTRDLDVQIQFLQEFYASIEENSIRPGIRRLLLRLTQRRKRLQEKIRVKTDKIINNSTLSEMITSLKSLAKKPSSKESYSQALFQLSFDTIHSRLDDFLFYEVFLFHPEKIKELHLMRIAAKKLRYSMEIFAPLYKGNLEPLLGIIRNIQQTLGNIRDCDVWITSMPIFMNKEKLFTINYYGYVRPFSRLLPGFQYLIDNREKQRNKLYNSFIEQWSNWRAQRIWLNLREFILEATLQTTSKSPNLNNNNLKNLSKK